MARSELVILLVAFIALLEPIQGFLPGNNSNIHITTNKLFTKGNRNKVITQFGKNNGDNNTTDRDRLLEKAEKLRQEVNSLEKEKEKEKKETQRIQNETKAQQEKEYMRYSTEVPILKGDGSEVMERVQFMPRLKAEGGLLGGKKESKIITVQAELPLGLILGESEELPGLITVDEIVEGSNGENAGVKVGDLLRACTACQVTMDMPTWQLMAGGIGRPKTSRMMFSTDGKPFEEVMEALVSNQMDPTKRPTWLVLERME